MKAIITFLFLIGLSWMSHAQNYPVPMSNQAFSQVLADLEAEAFDNDRISLAELVIDNNYLLADHLRQLLEQFDFKQQKERLAKRAYAKVYDQSNFYQVYAVFDFDDSKEKLRTWVSQQEGNGLNQSFHPEPMSAANFDRVYRQLEEASLDAEQLPLAKDLVDNNYLYAAQVRAIILLLDFKDSEDHFVQYAYSKTYDQQNYNMVLAALTFSSSKQRLSNWLKGQPVIDYANYGYTNNSTPQTWNSPYDDGDNINTAIRYNSVDQGRNNKFDTNPPSYNNTPATPIVISDADFTNIRSQLNQIPADKDRLIRVKEISDQSNWTAQQVRDLMDLLVFENMRLDFAMYAYGRTMDAQNYYLVHDGLSEADNQQMLMNYIQQSGGNLSNPSSVTNNSPNPTYNTTNRPLANGTQTLPTSTGGITVLSDLDFQASKKAVASYSSDSDRFEAAQSIVEEQYLNSNQVAELIQLFVFDDVRLKFAQLAYPKTQDKENYDQIISLMQNSSSQEALRQYISSN